MKELKSKMHHRDEVNNRKKTLALKLLKKLVNSKLRGHLNTVRMNSIAYFMHRQQMKFKSKLALVKILNSVMDKMKQSKFMAFSKIKEICIQSEFSGE